MTADEVIQNIDDNYAPLSIDAKISIDNLLDQLIRSTLEAAANAACTWCACHCAQDEVTECELRGGILAPLTKPATFPAHENDGQTA